MFPGRKRQDGDSPHREGRSLQSSSRCRWKGAGLCGVRVATATSSCRSRALLALLPCCAPWLWGGVLGKDPPSALAQGVQPQEPTGFFAASRPCKVHLETVPNRKIQFLEWQTQGCHKRERLYSHCLLPGAAWTGAGSAPLCGNRLCSKTAQNHQLESVRDKAEKKLKENPERERKKNLCQSKDETVSKANPTWQKAGNCLRRMFLKMPVITPPPHTPHTQGPQLQGLEETLTIFGRR